MVTPTPILTVHNDLRRLDNPANRIDIHIHPPRRHRPAARNRCKILLATPLLRPLRQRRVIPMDLDVVFLLLRIHPAAV